MFYFYYFFKQRFIGFILSLAYSTQFVFVHNRQLFFFHSIIKRETLLFYVFILSNLLYLIEIFETQRIIISILVSSFHKLNRQIDIDAPARIFNKGRGVLIVDVHADVFLFYVVWNAVVPTLLVFMKLNHKGMHSIFFPLWLLFTIVILLL